MPTHAAEYKRKLTTPQKAMEKVRNGDTIVHGLSTAEPPALLAAIADRAREGDLKDINIYSLRPQLCSIARCRSRPRQKEDWRARDIILCES